MDQARLIKSLEDVGLLKQCVREAIENKAKEQKAEFLDIILGTLCPSLLGNILTGKWVKQSMITEQGLMRAGKGTATVGRDF